METPVLALQGVTKAFGGLTAVNNMSFEVRRGEALGLMGPNGAGKTTLLNVISGEHRLDSGSIKLNGEDTSGLPPHRICRLGIARTYQVPQPFANMTATQNVAVAAIYGQSLAQPAALAEAHRILEFVGLGDRRDTVAKDMLVVTRKRLELARALATKPSVLLLDEVAAGLTEEELPEILGLIKQINQTNVTIILIEHIMQVMMQAVDRVIVMDKGAKLSEGNPEEVMNDCKVIEAYFG